jgi:hypothetical protein
MSQIVAPLVDVSRCPFCGSATEISPASRVYGSRSKDEEWGDVLVCSQFPRCDSFVGCHLRTLIPKGTLANRQLREWRKRAHAVFDQLWKERGRKSRRCAYRELARILEVPADQAHIGWCSIEQCQRIIEALSAPVGFRP